MKTAAGGLLLITAVACHGHSPTAPTPTSLAVGSSGPRVFLGATETFTATITLSDGTTEAATGTVWGTDAPAIATVDAGGVVTTHASGTVTVSVDSVGLHATKTVRVLPNYGGNWKGPFAIGNCSSTNSFHLTCTDLDDSIPRNMTATLLQTADAVSGTIAFGFLSAPMTATIASDGSMTFTAVTPPDVFKTYSGAWIITCTTDGTIHGTVIFTGHNSSAPADTLTFDGIVSGTRQ
jgi:hypothetical protein